MSTAEELMRNFALSTIITVLEAWVTAYWAAAGWIVGLCRMVVAMTQCAFTIKSSKSKSMWTLVLIGGAMNCLALAANGLRMPVFGAPRSEELVGLHKRGSQSTRLKFLTDRFLGDVPCIYSIGDIVMVIGFVLLTAKATYEELTSVIVPTRRVKWSMF